MKYDIFLGGPWEEFAPYPYKRYIKGAFPDKDIYDPEEQPSQETGEWFEDNYNALLNSKSMIAMGCPLPMSGVTQEFGMYYVMHNDGNFERPLEELIMIWPQTLKPEFGKDVAEKMGYIVENVGGAIEKLKLNL